MLSFKRPAALAVAALAIAALAACTGAPAEPAASMPAAPPAPAETSTAPSTEDEGRAEWEALAAEAMPVPVPELLDTTPMPVDEYVARFSASSGTLDSVEAVQAEYREAAQVFPLALPDGYAFPTDSWLRGDDGGSWQQGNGVVQAYFYWQMATATAAFHDHVRGDQSAAEVHLDALAAGYDSSVRAMFVEDPDLGFIERTVAPAYQGDFDHIYTDEARHFLGHHEYAAVSAHAGDWEYLGTEGYAVAGE